MGAERALFGREWGFAKWQKINEKSGIYVHETKPGNGPAGNELRRTGRPQT